MKKDKQSADIKYSDDVIRLIAGCATQDVEGVIGMSKSIIGRAAKRLGRKDFIDGVRCTVKDKTVAIDVYVILQFGYRLSDIAVKIQRAVKEAIERDTDFEVTEVNVNIQGVDIGKNSEL